MLPATQFPSYQACDAGQRSSAAQAILEGDGPSCPSGRFIMNPLIYPYYGTITDSINGVYLSSGFTVTRTDCNGVTTEGGVDPGYSCNTGPVCPANWSQYCASSQPPTGTQGTRITGAVCYSNEPDRDKCDPDSNVGNPIDIGSRLKTASETDLPLLGALSVSRSYRSDRGQWVWNHQSKGFDTAGAIPDTACLTRYDRSATQRCFKFAPSDQTLGFTLLRSDGRLQTFGGDTGYAAPSTVNDRVARVTASNGSFLYFEVTDIDGNKERYGAAGALLAKQSRQGVLQNFTYNASRQPTKITDSFDRSVTFAYSATNGNLVSAAEQTGATVLFGYDLANNLTSVTYPDGSVKQYLYNEQSNTDGTDLSGTLTGIIDENGTRYATYKYDSERRAISTEHAGGVEKYLATYTGRNGYQYVIDPLGTQRAYTFQNINYIAKTASISESCASCGGTRSLAITYDLNANVSSRGDFNGNKTCFEYDLTRNLETARVEGVAASADCAASLTSSPNRPDVRKTTTTWHSTYRLPVTITESAAAATVSGMAGIKTTQHTYDANGNLLQKDVTAPKNDGTSATELRSWKWTYNALGQVLTAKDPLNQTTTTVYYASTDIAVPPKFTKGDVQTVTNAAGHVTTFNEYEKNGRLTKMTDANGLMTTMTYHPRGWLSSRAASNSVATETTTYAYDNVGQLTRVTMPDGSMLNYAYEDAHRMVGISDQSTGTAPAGNGSLRMQLANLTGNKILYTLDAMGNRTTESNFDPSGALAKTKTRVIDSLNRLQQYIGGTTYATAPTTAVTQYGYDNNGNVTSTTDPLGRVTTNNYDALNRLTAVIDPYNGASKPTTYLYDNANNLTRVTDPEGKSTEYTYNGYNNLITQLSPDTGATKFTYNAMGNVVTKFDAMNRCSLTTYDNLHRATAIRYFAATNASTNTAAGCAAATTATLTVEETIAYTFDAAAGGAGAKGRGTKITDNSGTLDYTYDANGRVTSKKHTLVSNAVQNGGATNVAKAVTYRYNASGQMTDMVTPSGQLITYVYGAPNSAQPGKVTGVKVNGVDVIKGVEYKPFGPTQGWVWGNDSNPAPGPATGNGVYTTHLHLRDFDADYRPVTIESYLSTEASSEFPTNGYVRNIIWDQSSRITAITVPGAIAGLSNGQSLNQAFAYDQLDRLTTFNAGVAGATTRDAGMALLPNEAFTYDGIGNRKTRATQAPGTTSTQSTSYAHGSAAPANHWLTGSTGSAANAWSYDASGNAMYEANARMWGGYGSSPGAPASPLYTATSTSTYARALASAYDAKNRLSKVSIAAANTPQSNTQSSADTVSYRINALGQRVQKIGAGLFAAAATNPTSPFAVTLSNPPTALQLQALNTQTQAFYANSRFVYDEQGRLLGEYAKDGKLIAETVWFGDLPIALLKPKGANVLQPTSGTTTTGNQGANNTGANGNTGAQPAAANPTDSVATERFYVHPDHLGTPRVITKPQAGPTFGDNVQVWRWDSDPFGSNATANSAPNENPLGTTQVMGTAALPYLFKMNHRFPGQLSDEETGKHYNYFRDYDPGIGRYVESDPIGLRAGVSTFGYVHQSPNRFADRFGLDIRVCFYADAASGLGHIGYGLPGEGGTTGFYPYDPGLPGLMGSGVIGRDRAHPATACKVLPATPDQDGCMEDCRRDRTMNPGNYNLAFRQCTDFVRSCLARCKFGNYGGGPMPGNLFDQLPPVRHQ